LERGKSFFFFGISWQRGDVCAALIAEYSSWLQWAAALSAGSTERNPAFLAKLGIQFILITAAQAVHDLCLDLLIERKLNTR